MNKHEAFHVVETIEEWEKDIGRKNGNYGSTLTEDLLNKIKDYYMVKYLGSWDHDW